MSISAQLLRLVVSLLFPQTVICCIQLASLSLGKMTSCFSSGLIVLIKLRHASWNYALVRLIFISSISLRIGKNGRYLPNLKSSLLGSKSQQYNSSCGGYVSSLKTSLILLSLRAATIRSEWSKAFTSVFCWGCFGLDFFMAWEQRYSPMGRFQVFLFMGLRPVCGRLLLEECEQTIWDDFFSVFSWLSLLACRFPSTILREMQFSAGLKGNSWRYCFLSSSLRCSICLWSSKSLSKRSVRCC